MADHFDMSVFEFNDSRQYLRGHLKSLPKKGRGELSKIAAHLQTNSTLLSQILSGTRHFNAEQTYSLSRYLGHTDLELEYFSLLVQKEKAGNHELKKHLEKRLTEIKTEAQKLSKRISHELKLNDQQRAIFYSSWIYSAVHLLTSTNEKGINLDEIIEYFNLPRERAIEIVHFLSGSGLVVEERGRYQFAVKSTFVEKGSPFLLKHHSNWRVNAIRKSEELLDQELMYTGQFSLSEKDFHKLREKMTEFLKSINDTVKDSPPEKIAAFNMDWFWIK